MKVGGTSLQEIDRIVKKVPGVSSALAERLNGDRYVDIHIDCDAASRYGLDIANAQSIVSAGIGGDNIGETVEGLSVRRITPLQGRRGSPGGCNRAMQRFVKYSSGCFKG